MKLSVNDQNLIVVEDAKKEDVDFVIVDGVFFERKQERFVNITNDNIYGYNVQIAPTNSIYMELQISSQHKVDEIVVIVEDKQRQHSKILFTPLSVN